MPVEPSPSAQPARIDPPSWRGPLARVVDRACAYLLERQSPRGGFCFYRSTYSDEPNLSDTWHAVATLAALGREVPDRERHARFVSTMPLQEQASGLQNRVRVLDLLAWADPQAGEVADLVRSLAARLPPPRGGQALASELERARAMLWLARHLGVELPERAWAESVLRLEHPEGGFGEPANLIETAAAVAMLDTCGQVPTPQTMDFVRRMAMPRFGFRLTADSLSPNLETVSAGVASCHCLGIEVPYADDTVSFILSCQTGNGGFARAADALPDFTLTHMAVVALGRLATTQEGPDV